MGPGELAVILVVALLLFGSRLPEVSRSMGKALKEFKRGVSDFKSELDKDLREERKP
ncbi:MAG: twin-arginine translocase TatA/TatE family subunit [Planctomycetes bacterium]|nr:twin-arginine translocase TatA/TatE family subunit [Planctomycetota bacterium]